MSLPFLQNIKDAVQQRAQTMHSLEALQYAVRDARVPHNFLEPFCRPCDDNVRIIAEIKFARPGKGRISSCTDAVDVARQYLANGATALSILTEPQYFEGALSSIQKVRQVFPHALILMKDFIFELYQLYEARINGADAVLLIVALLSVERLQLLYTTALELGLTPLVEVHDETELPAALNLKNLDGTVGAKFIGINNRNLKTLQVDISATAQLLPLIPPSIPVISESGISTAHDLRMLIQRGVSGMLIGSHFMTTNEPGRALNQLLKECSDES